MPVFSGIFHKPKLLGVRFHLQFLRHCHVVTLQYEEESSHMILFKSNSCNFSLWMPVLPPFARHWQAMNFFAVKDREAVILTALGSAASWTRQRATWNDDAFSLTQSFTSHLNDDTYSHKAPKRKRWKADWVMSYVQWWHASASKQATAECAQRWQRSKKNSRKRSLFRLA